MFRAILSRSVPLINSNISKNRFMSSLIRTKYDEWYFKENDYYKVGLTENIIEDIHYLEIENNKFYEKDDIIGCAENLKGYYDFRALFDCKLLEINEKVIENIDILNNDLENTDTSWIVKLRPTDQNHEELLETIRVTREDVQRCNHLNKSSLWLNIYGREFLLS